LACPLSVAKRRGKQVALSDPALYDLSDAFVSKRFSLYLDGYFSPFPFLWVLQHREK
jgi:hypothetical protein